MKKITLSLFLLISSLSLSTQECSLGEKEFLELTYMTKEELISDYCASTEFGKSTQIQGVKLADAGASQSGLELIEDGTTCLNYAEKVFRVLRKDFKIKSKEDIKCPEVKQKIAKYWFSVLQDIICLEIEKLEKHQLNHLKIFYYFLKFLIILNQHTLHHHNHKNHLNNKHDHSFLLKVVNSTLSFSL